MAYSKYDISLNPPLSPIYTSGLIAEGKTTVFYIRRGLSQVYIGGWIK